MRLEQAHYRQYEAGFKQWLRTMGMSASAQYNMPHHIRELLHFMEQREIISLDQITIKDVQDYFGHLATRPNNRRAGGISNSYYNKQLQAAKKFSRYIWHHYKLLLPITIKLKPNVHKKPAILTQEEIGKVYDATGYDRLLQLRDEVMLDLFYGCGLRRNEVVQLEVKDIYIERRLLHVRHGKAYTERYVPITKSGINRMNMYLSIVRGDLLAGESATSFLISSHGYKMDGGSMLVRIKKLCERTKSESIRNKNIGLHTLRHSIATHLLHGGMSLHEIARFLGHKSIEATQIYTHLVHEL